MATVTVYNEDGSVRFALGFDVTSTAVRYALRFQRTYGALNVHVEVPA